MKNASLRWAPLLLALCAGCSSGTSSKGSLDGGGGGGADGGPQNGDGNPDQGDVPGGGFSLHVVTASAEVSVGGVRASTGKQFIVVNLTLKNDSASAPLSTNPLFFSLKTSQSLVITFAGVSPENLCDSSVSVATGGNLSCAIAFEMPSDQTAAALLYDDLKGHKASAAIPPIDKADDSCQTTEDWYGASSSICGDCLTNSEQTACTTAATAYASKCTTCTNTCETETDYCACEKKCDTAECQTLFQAFNACLVTACAAQCP